MNGVLIIPDTVDRSIWDPTKLDITRQISSIIPEGSGTSLTDLQELIDKMDGKMITSNNAYVTNQRDLNPIQDDFATQGLNTIENDPLLNDEQKQSTLGVFGILLMLVAS